MSVREKAIDAAEKVQEFEDGRCFDSRAVRKITQEWVDDKMKTRESEFTEAVSVKIFCGTWNVNAKKQEGGLHDWILPRDQPLADVYAIGFQEIVDLNAMNVALDGSKTQQRSQFWQSNIMECLNSTTSRFVMVAEKHLVGLLIIVYVKDSLFPNVKDVRTASAGVGLMGMMGNKGGTSIRMSLYDSSVCFVCSHLAAHLENVAGRNSDFKSIVDRTVFPSENAGGTGQDDEIVVRPRYGADRYTDSDVSIGDHELIFWIGDLNYRIGQDVATEEVFNRIDVKDLEYLRVRDQLNVERGKGNVFQGYEEGVINFPPTYKFQPGTDLYERRAEKKLRAPAWCDRVLWKSASPQAVRLLNYRCSTLRPSDHKPVSALLDVDLRIVVTEREQSVYSSLMNSLEYWKSAELPVAEVVGHPIDEVNVQFNVKRTCTVHIKNKGRNYLHWHFISKLEDSRICKKWISVNVASGLLFPDESVPIEITILVNKETAQDLNLARDSLNDVLILRIENFNDIYINVTATYQRSCFGMQLEELNNTPGPVVLTHLPATAPLCDAPPVSTAPPMLIPKEFWRLVDSLYVSNALVEPDLFSKFIVSEVADEDEVNAVIAALDRNVEFPNPCSPHIIAVTIVQFLTCLPRPLLPLELIPGGELDVASCRSSSRRLLEALPCANYNLFVYLMSFFREVLAQSEFNGTTAVQLASLVVSSCCSQPVAEAETLAQSLSEEELLARQQNVQKLVLHMLSTTAM